MTDIRTSLPIPTQPWEAARARFLDGLSSHESEAYASATLENLFYDASSGQKDHARGSRMWRLQERLAPLTEGLEDYGKAMDVYVNTCPLILSPLWGSLRVVILIAAEAAKFQESLVDMLAQIGDVLPRFRIYEQLFRDHERLLVALSAAYLDVLQFCVASKDFFLKARRSKISLSIVLRGLWKSHLRVFDVYISQFRAHSKQVEKEASLAHMIESARVRDIELQTRALQVRNAKLNTRNRVLASLPAINYLSKQAKLSETKFPGTCKWLLDNPAFKTWYTQSSSSCICCFGIPGSGKSLLAASVRDFLVDDIPSNDNSLVCFYYCDYSDKASLDPTYILASITKQVLEHLNLDHFGDDFKCPYREDQGLPTFAVGLKYLLGLLNTYKITYMVLDGIDELDTEAQTRTLSLIDALLNESSKSVKVFVTSRTEEIRVKQALGLYPTIFLSETKVDEDIAAFIKGEISRIQPPHPLTSDHKLREEVTRTLVDGARGMFLWAKFQLIDIKEALTESDLRTTLEHLPATLNETYLRILHRTFQGPGGPAKLDSMRRTFRWIAVARRPPRLEELEEGIALEPTDTHLHTDRIPKNAGAKLISDCGNLAIINDNDNTISFAHHTVKQFLLSRYSPSDTIANLLDLTSSEAEVGDICLAYLDFSDFETQIAKAPSQAQLQVPIAHEMVWANVPFAGHVRDALAWTAPWRSKTVKHDPKLLNLAIPLPYTPTEILNKKYVLLEYIIENWVYHTSHLRPSATSWANFQHVALYRQLDFEFRPWNESVHQSCVNDAMQRDSDFWKTQKKRKPLLSPPRDLYQAHIKIYAWAFSHAVGSLFGLLDSEVLTAYLQTGSDRMRASTYFNDYDIGMIVRFLQTLLRGGNIPSLSQQRLKGWRGELVMQIMRTAHESAVQVSPSYFIAFLDAEYSRWLGEDAWNMLLIETAVCALRNGDKFMFDSVWKRCIADTSLYQPYGTRWHESYSFKAVEALLQSCLPPSHVTWDFMFFLQNYPSADHLIWTVKGSPTCKDNAHIIHAVLVTALGRKLSLYSLLNLWSVVGLLKDRHQSSDLVGKPSLSKFGSHKALDIDAAWQVNTFALAEELESVLPCFTNKHSRDLVLEGITKVVAIWNQYNRCFNVRIFEKSDIELMSLAIIHKSTDAVKALAPLYEKISPEEDGRLIIERLLEEARDAPAEILQIVTLLQDSRRLNAGW